MNFTKIAYHDPRPYFTSDEITPYGCSSEYGNPSGHSLFAAGFFFFIFLDILHGEYKNKTLPKYVYPLSLAGAIIMTFLIGFARLYVGVHSMN